MKDYRQQKEIWRDIVGYEGYYQVSNKGRVKSLDRIITDVNGIKYKRSGKIMKATNKKSGYVKITLNIYKCPKSYFIHRLVAVAFIPNPFNKCCVNHIDSNRSNNNVKNLEWVTHKENMAHAIEFGYAHGILKRDWGAVVKLYKNGESVKRISKVYNVSRGTIQRILNESGVKLSKYNSETFVENFEYNQGVIIKLYQSGLSKKKIGNIVGISISGVRGILLNNNIPIRNGLQTISMKNAYRDHRIISLYALGLTLKRTSKIANTSIGTIKRVLRQNNIEIRDYNEAVSTRREITHITNMSNKEILEFIKN